MSQNNQEYFMNYLFS